MEANYDCREVVLVIDGFRLIDGESYERRYQRHVPVALPRGYYVVDWPSGSTRRRFDAHARFNGPWATRTQALAALAHEPSPCHVPQPSDDSYSVRPEHLSPHEVHLATISGTSGAQGWQGFLRPRSRHEDLAEGPNLRAGASDSEARGIGKTSMSPSLAV